MTHFTDQELRRWSDHGTGDDNARVIAHLTECPRCATRFASAVRTRAADGPSTDDVSDFVRAGRAPAAGAAASRSAMFALAASVILAVGVLIQIAVHQRQAPPAEPRFRGSAIRTLSPAGTVGVDSTFTWSSGVEAARYQIDIGESDGPIYSFEATTPPVAFSAELLAKLSRGRPYWWTVTARDSTGRAIGVSERRTFTLRTP